MSRTAAADRARWERRFREAGAAIVTMRLSPAAMSALSALCTEFGCNRKDVIEGLLLGTIKQSATHASIDRKMRDLGATRGEAVSMLPQVPRGARA